jgi:hypothetical protein
MKDIVKTSAKDWLGKAVKLYTARKKFTLNDDAGVGINEVDLKSAVTLIRAAKHKGAATWQQIAAVFAGHHRPRADLQAGPARGRRHSPGPHRRRRHPGRPGCALCGHRQVAAGAHVRDQAGERGLNFQSLFSATHSFFYLRVSVPYMYTRLSFLLSPALASCNITCP